MQKYYIIPVTDDTVLVDNKSLREILVETNPELYERDIERTNILKNTLPDSQKQILHKHDRKTIAMYVKKEIPTHIIAYGNDDYAFEMITNRKITGKYPSSLSIREIPKERAELHFYKTYYGMKIANFIKPIEKKKHSNDKIRLKETKESI